MKTPFLAGAAAACCGLCISAHAQVYTLDPPACSTITVENEMNTVAVSTTAGTRFYRLAQ